METIREPNGENRQQAQQTTNAQPREKLQPAKPKKVKNLEQEVASLRERLAKKEAELDARNAHAERLIGRIMLECCGKKWYEFRINRINDFANAYAEKIIEGCMKEEQREDIDLEQAWKDLKAYEHKGIVVVVKGEQR